MLFNSGVGEALESPLDCKEIQAVHPKQNQPWRFIARTDAEAETPILCPPEAKKWKRKYWGQEKKGATEDEMTGWHHRLNGHAFEQTPGAGDGHGGLPCYSPWGHKESDTCERLNWTEHGFKSQTLVNGFNTILPMWDKFSYIWLMLNFHETIFYKKQLIFSQIFPRK